MISKQQFQKRIAEQKAQQEIKKWADLEEGEVYQITSSKFIDTKYGKSCVIDITDIGQVFAPSSLSKRLQEKGKRLPALVMPNGLVESKKNPGQHYHGFDLLWD